MKITQKPTSKFPFLSHSAWFLYHGAYMLSSTVGRGILCLMLQKQSSGAVCKKGVLKYFTKLTGKHLCQSLFFNKVVGLRPTGLKRNCSPVNFAKFLRASFVQNTSGKLFLPLDHGRLILKVAWLTCRWIKMYLRRTAMCTSYLTENENSGCHCTKNEVFH